MTPRGVSHRHKLTTATILAFAAGQLGLSILNNILGMQLVFFYLPPSNAGLPLFITQITILGLLNAIAIVGSSGRLLAAFIDPLIAHLSDHSTNPRGRRIPLAKRAVLPCALSMTLLFVPPVTGISPLNIVWIALLQVLFFIAVSFYNTPLTALIPQLAHNEHERLQLTTWMSISWAAGMVIAAFCPLLAEIAESTGGLTTVRSFQYAIGALALLAFLLMLAPVAFIKEEPTVGGIKPDPLLQSLKSTFRNVHFRYYIIADFSYMTALNIIMGGFLYHVTVLLGLPKSKVSTYLTLMVAISFGIYPFIGRLARRFGKKNLIVTAFVMLAAGFTCILFLGKVPLEPELQALIAVTANAVPAALLGVLPMAVLTDIAEHHGLVSGQRQEGMFFAARTMMIKLGSTFGILIFAGLMTLGKDPGNDLGIRLGGAAGIILSLVSALAITRYNENGVLGEIREHR